MSEDLEYEPLDAAPAANNPAAAGRDADLLRLRDVPVNLAVEIGRAKMTVGETLALRPGSIVTLDRLAEEPLDLLVNGTRIARGEVVVIDEDFGLRITEVQNASGEHVVAAAGGSSAGSLGAGAPVGGELPGESDAEVVDATSADEPAANAA
jgi:flagellar motor switch protein FliN/FliY